MDDCFSENHSTNNNNSTCSSGSFPESLLDAFQDLNGLFPELPGGGGGNEYQFDHLVFDEFPDVIQTDNNSYQNGMHMAIDRSVLEQAALDRKQSSISSSSIWSLSESSTSDHSSQNSVPIFLNDSVKSIKQNKQDSSSSSCSPADRVNMRFGSDDEALTRAMLAVISSGNCCSSASVSLQLPEQDHLHTGAFKPYNKNKHVVPNSETMPNSSCQKMIKTVLSKLREIKPMNNEDVLVSDSQLPSTGTTSAHQRNHVISERRRREKLNESFDVLRSLLPPRCKKDKTSVLMIAKNYLNTLQNEISELKAKNEELELRLESRNENRRQECESIDTVQVEVTKSLESKYGIHDINLKIAVKMECDILELALHVLECLKEMMIISLISVDASTRLPSENACANHSTLTLQIQANEWNEELFKQIITQAVYNLA